MLIFRRIKPLFLLLTFIVIACSSSPKHESMVEYLDDAAVTASVKTKLLDELGSKGFDIKVITHKDEVQLRGIVDNADIKQRAGIVAASAHDVHRVRNDLIIKK